MTTQQIVRLNRDSNGLLPNIQYILTEEGKIDWRKMIPAKFLYPNPKYKQEVEKLLGKSTYDYNSEVDNVPDKWLAILLGGIRYLATLRGVTDVSYVIGASSNEYASVTCKLSFPPIFDSELVTFSDCGSASLHTTNDFGQNY